MANPPFQYKKLPGRGLVRATTIWLGPDHLLSAELAGIAEEYKRFYYRDIQAVIVRRTKTGFVVNTVFGGLACFFALLALVDDVGWWSMFTIAIIVLIVNTIMGPTCKTSLKTAVQLEKLTPWGRVRRARRGISQLRERIAAAQGEISPADAMSRLTATENAPPVSETPPAPEAPLSPEPPAQPSLSPSPE